MAVVGDKPFHMAKEVVLQVVAENNVHTFNLGDLVGGILCEAAYYGYNSVGVGGNGLAYCIAAFLFCNSGDSAGVYDIQVGNAIEICRFPACVKK